MKSDTLKPRLLGIAGLTCASLLSLSAAAEEAPSAGAETDATAETTAVEAEGATQEPLSEAAASTEGSAPSDAAATSDESATSDDADGFGFDDETQSSGSSGTAGVELPSALNLELGLGAVGRSLHFVDSDRSLGIKNDVPVYDNTMDAAFVGQVSGHWYPLAHFMAGPFAHLGLSGSYARALARSSDYTFDNGTTGSYSQTYQQFTAGLRGRIPLPWLTLGVEANYGSQSLWVRTANDAAPLDVFPDVSYSYIEGKLDAEIRVNQVSVSGYFGYLQGLGVGEIGTGAGWFENAKGFGFHYGGQVGYRVAPGWDLVGGIEARSFGLNFNPVDPDPAVSPRVAGGASDLYVSFLAGLRFTLPGRIKGGSPSTSGQPASAPATGGSGSGGDSFDDFD